MQTPKHLVLIDDDSGVLRALALLLQTLRYSVTPFTAPVEAVEYVEGGAPVDLVVTDLRMPLLSGEGVLRRIRAYNPDVPVIVMSGHATAQDMAALKRDGASGFIPKPFTPAHFQSALDDIAHSKTREPQNSPVANRPLP